MLPLALALALASAASPLPPLPSVEQTFLYDLSTPDGLVALTWPSLSYDRAHDEVFVVSEGFVRIFDSTGMEVHRFGDDGSLGTVLRAVALEDGQMVVLTNLNGTRAFLRCDFRGELLEPFSLKGLPKGFEKFEPDQLVLRGGNLYFAERSTMRVVQTDADGVHLRSFQLRTLIARATAGDTERKGAATMDAFNVDSAGNLLFTVSTMFAGGKVTPAGVLQLFGSRGSTPGKFNIIGGIDADEAGNVFVTDRLRSVVSVWDPTLHHLDGDFGYRGSGDSNLVTPYELVVGNGKVFVAQAGKKGVKVFRVRLVVPEPATPISPAPAAAPAPVPAPRIQRVRG